MIKFLRKLFKSKQKDPWYYGNPPNHIPKSWITYGMKYSEKDNKVISCWRYNSNYYANLL